MKPDYLKELLETVAKKAVQDFARELTEKLAESFVENARNLEKIERVGAIIDELVKEKYGE